MQLTYEKVAKCHAKELHLLWTDPEIIRYTNIKVPCDDAATNERMKRFKGQECFVIMLSDQVVGLVGCPTVNAMKNEFGLFYQIRKEVWGRGIATIAAEWMVQHMKEVYPKLTLYADVVAENVHNYRLHITES